MKRHKELKGSVLSEKILGETGRQSAGQQMKKSRTDKNLKTDITWICTREDIG